MAYRALVDAAREGTFAERMRRGELLPGFGHAYYGRSGDPRGRRLVEIAREAAGPDAPVAFRTLEAVVAAMERAERPPLNVDIGLVALRAALGLPVGSAVGFFCVGRCAGWIAHAIEQAESGHLLRPRARYREA